MKWPARGSLVWRLYALGLAQLVLLAASVVFVGYLLRPLPDPGLSGAPWERSVPSAPGEPARPPRSGAHPEPPRHRPPGPWGPLATFFVSGVLIVGVGAALSWRWMARPVAHLSRVARSLGSGELGARARLTSGDELGELGRGFDDMAERIEGLVLTQKELLANVSHELRTPLARIRVALDIASEGDAGVARASLEEIAVDLSELEGMIDDILTTTRIELQRRSHKATGFSLRRRDVAPRSIAEHASERFRARYPERELSVAIADGLPAVHVDAGLFRRVLDNLLDNAHKYSPPERGIVFRLRGDGVGVAFEVLDEGIGIAPGDLPRVFDPFFRAERSRSRGTGGVGLGLTLAKRIVDAHGGRIELESSVARGTRARVRLDRSPIEERPASVVSSEPEPRQTASSAG
jgi:signal transduction histidine kinase